MLIHSKPDLTVVGGGLAGCEAAWQAATRGLLVHICEMRPLVSTGAHTSDRLAELVCSNSLGSDLSDRAAGVLKNELRGLNSLLLQCASETSLPAGGALAVDRDAFAKQVTDKLTAHPNVRIIREEVRLIPETPAIIATGPLTSPALAQQIMALAGQDYLYFYDAIAPIVLYDSIDFATAFRASRYQRGENETGDYINCPMTQDEYERFVNALLSAERIPLKQFELPLEQGVRAGADEFFEGCLPVEVLAKRGRDALAYGPMRPVGLVDPRTGRRPYAVVQLRQDNLAGTLYNLVGFQTNLTFPEQERVLRLIPGLEQARFARYGQMHRNTFIYSPGLLLPTLQFRSRSDLLFAGQIIGVEGYVGNIGTGLLAGWNAARILQGKPPLILSPTMMLGALCHYVTHASAKDFQPMKANFGILPPLEEQQAKRPGKKERGQLYALRSQAALENLLSTE